MRHDTFAGRELPQATYVLAARGRGYEAATQPEFTGIN